MERLLFVGYGDIARRVAARLPAGTAPEALSRQFGHDLDRPLALDRSHAADAVLHSAPPPAEGETDPRTENLLAAIERGAIIPARIAYLSTSGVYGDCGGALVDESRPVNPGTDRARRRVDAEGRLARWCARHGVALVVLRVPGIYAADRLPLARLRARTAVLCEADDVYTNHIHADDLAGICLRALAADAAPGVYNACDDTRMKMGAWLDLVADRAGLPRAPRIARADAPGRVPPALLSFMSESRLLCNAKLKRALGVRLAYSTVLEGVPRAMEPA